MKKVLAVLTLALLFSTNAFAMGFWDSSYQKCNSKVYSTCKSKGEGTAAYTQCVNDETNKCSCSAFKRPLGIYDKGVYKPYTDASGNAYTCS